MKNDEKKRSMTSCLKKLATCAICLETLKQPRMLSCQHTFCLPCAQNLIAHKPKEPLRVRCALCRVVTLLPKGGVEALPGNICLQSVLDLINTPSLSDDSQQCSGCQTFCKLTFCQHCRRSFCPICTKIHLDDLRDQLQSIYEQLQAAKGRVQDRMQSFLESTVRVRDAIQLEIQKRIQDLQGTEAKLLEEMGKISDQERERTCHLSHKLEASSDRVQELMTGDFEQTAGEFEKVALFMSVHKECSDALIFVDSAPSTTVTFSEKSLEVTNECLALPHMDPNVPISPHPCEEEEASEASISLEQNGESNSSDTHSLFYRSKHFLTKVRFDSASMKRPTGVAVSPWSNELYAVSTDTHMVFVYDMKRAKYLRHFGIRGHRCGEFLCPYGIALSPATQEILITDKWKHCIHLFSQSENFIRQIGTQGSGPRQFRGPESICIDQQGRIYVCDTCNKRIQVLDKRGAFLKEIVGTVPTNGFTNQCVLQEPSGIAVSGDGRRIVICDVGNHRIHVFDNERNLLQTFGQKGSLRGQFNTPECVAIDNKGFIFVGDSGNGRVQIFRPDGRFVRSFGSNETSTRHFKWISGIAITANYSVVISDFKDHNVQIC